MSQLTTLNLIQSRLSEEHLGELLLATPCLRKLSYLPYFDIDSEGRRGNYCDRFIDYAKLNCALSHVTNTLEYLDISVQVSSRMTILPGFWEMRGRIEPLNDFRSITDLKLPLIMLLGWDLDIDCTLSDILPHKLQKPCITDALISWEKRNQTDR